MNKNILKEVASEIYQILRSYNKTIILYDQNGNQTYNPDKASRMFLEPDNIMLSFVQGDQNNEIRIYISNNIKIDSILDMITSIRHSANRFGFILTMKKYGSKITPRDFINGKITESIYGSSSKISYEDIGKYKLVINHDKDINPDKKGSRSRDISNIFLENLETSERIKLPSNSISIARAFAKHFTNDGKYNDKIYKFLESISNEKNILKTFQRKNKNKLNLDENLRLKNAIKNRLDEIKFSTILLSGSRNYKRYYDVFSKEQNYDDIFDFSNFDNIEDIQNIKSNLGYKNTILPVITTDDIKSLEVDIKGLTNYKKYIDYDLTNDGIIFYTPDSFSDALCICERFGIEYKLKAKEKIMEEDNNTITFPSKEVRDEVLSNIRDDFSYGESEVKAVGDNMISFSNSDIEDELKDYINVLTANNNSSTDYGLKEWLDSFNPDVFLKEREIPGLTKEESLIQNAPDFFDNHEYTNILRSKDLFRNNLTADEQKEAISILASYLRDKIEEREAVSIDPRDLYDTAKGLYFRRILPLVKNEKLSEDVIKILESMEASDFITEEKSFDKFMSGYLKARIKLDENLIQKLIKEYRSVLEPLFKIVNEDEETIDNPSDKRINQNMLRKYSGIQPGTRVVTPRGKGTVENKKVLKLNRRTVPGYDVKFDDGHVEFYVERDITPIKNASQYLNNPAIKNNFGIQDDLIVKDAYVKEDDEEGTVTLDTLADEFLADENYGGLIRKAFGKSKVIDIEYLEDRVIAYLLKHTEDSNEEDIQEMENIILNKLSSEGFKSEMDEDEPEIINTNYQSSIMDKIKSDRVNNPYHHTPGTIDSDQVDQITRLKALAGLSRNG